MPMASGPDGAQPNPAQTLAKFALYFYHKQAVISGVPQTQPSQTAVPAKRWISDGGPTSCTRTDN